MRFISVIFLLTLAACSSVKPPTLGTCDGEHKKPINVARD